MADFLPAFQNTLKWEDSKLHPGVVTPEPHNGRARLGINSIAHPDLPDWFWTANYADAIIEAKQIEHDDYWVPLKLDAVNDQDVANKIFDMAINTGVKTAARMTQEALEIEIDGVIGPITIAAINDAAPDKLLTKLRSLAIMHYQSLAAEDPAEYNKWLPDWLQRAKS